MTLKTIGHWTSCRLGMHDWTCKAEQGIGPEPGELNEGLAGFLSYACSYCRHCGRKMPLAVRHIEAARREGETSWPSGKVYQ